ncbi:MAG: hypothetical protein Q9159_000266 [Coniocarpon cinnabarinum]
MHRTAQRSVCYSFRRPARLIAGRRFPHGFRRSRPPSTARSFSASPLRTNGPDENPNFPEGDPLNGQVIFGQPGLPIRDGSGGPNPRNGSSKSSTRKYRTQKSEGLSPITIPGWFLDNNVKLSEDQQQWHATPLDVVGESDEAQTQKSEAHQNQSPEEQPREPAEQHGGQELTQNDQSSVQEDDTPKSYKINQSVFAEIQACLSSGLSSLSEDAETFVGGKTHVRIYCPFDGATYFLEKTVEHAADELGADVVRLDAQDLAQIAGDYIKEGTDATSHSLWSLAFDAQNALPKNINPFAPPEQEEGDEEGEDYAVEDMEDRDGRPPKQHTMTGLTAIPLASFPVGRGGDFSSVFDQVRKAFHGGPPGQGQQAPMQPGTNLPPGLIPVNQSKPADQIAQWNDHKLDALLEVLVDANTAKRTAPQSEEKKLEKGVTVTPADSEENATQDSESTKMPRTGPETPRTILLIRGSRELSFTHQGRLILEKLIDIVHKKRRNGQRLVIAGISASSALTPDFSHNALMDLQADGQRSLFRTVVVLPEGDKGAIFRDAPRETRAINMRHLHSMVERLWRGSGTALGQDLESFTKELNQVGILSAEGSTVLDSQLFAFDEIHRVAVTALGIQLQNASEQNAAQAVATAMRVLERSDDVKTELGHAEQQIQKPAPESSKAKSHTDARLKKLRKQCNHHERSLLKGVVHSENIRTTFDHVHAPAETVESLKNLTMLSLTRPEAFKYGVLATDKITGCLLYGPPGTGKTLLAKAVAKESGATVLEVSGSDVYDMYVGESEKNVRAIFSLAKKLSPCVVFIDEADAIFASRGSGTNRNSHRELINQFLREWDGMTDTNAFIMVATNRPFDLDDAALRRLPRRLLVDLPNEKDRESILKIHLADEALDSAVTLHDLATRTPLYSGSDLKNMCVAAALAAVKEENDSATKHNAEKEDEDPAFVFPERRTLELRHFEKAMEEITSSVSEDMSSLGAIRKFDEKYGDRRGRKKRGSYGFAVGGEGKKEDAVKVRS